MCDNSAHYDQSKPLMNFCSHCGSQVELRIPEGDNRTRHVCLACGTVHYENPKIVVGCVVEHDERILLCKRAIEPRYGLWTLPAGFLENGESVEAGAARETFEEASAEVDVLGLYAMFSLKHINQVYMMFRARLLEPRFGPGTESLAVELLHEEQIPWRELAFPVIDQTLKLYLEDRKAGSFGTHVGEMIVVNTPDGRRRIETRLLR